MRNLLVIFFLLFAVNVYAADTKLSALPDLDPLASTDTLYCVDDPGGTPVSSSCKVSTILTDALIPNTITIDLSSTATALAADPTDCSAGSYTIGINASGTAQGCTDATTEINSVVNGLGGTNLTCASENCDVDDAFLVNNANDSTSGTLTATGFIIGSADINETDLEKIDGITNGTAAANKAVVLDGSLDIATINSLTATTLVGALTGNASTATALAADPDDCAANNFATTIAASGNLTCAQPALGTATTGNYAASDAEAGPATSLTTDSLDAITEIAAALKAGADATLMTGTAGGDGICAEFNADGDIVAAVSAAACGAGGSGDAWSDAVDSDILPTGNDNTFDLGSAAASFKDVFWDGTATGNVTGALTGNASTSSALAADPDDCAGSTVATAIAANGNLTCGITPIVVADINTFSELNAIVADKTLVNEEDAITLDSLLTVPAFTATAAVILGDGGDNFSVASDGIDIDTSGNITNGGTIGSGAITSTGAITAGGATAGIVLGGETGDPCGTLGEGAIFYNTTGNFMCYCDGTDDLKMNDNSTACF